DLQPISPVQLIVPDGPEPREHCDIWTEEYRARVSARGAALQSFLVLPGKYRRDDEPIDLVTTPDHPQLRPLHATFRLSSVEGANGAEPDWLVGKDVLDWRIVRNTGTLCELEYRDDRVLL